MYVSIDIPVPDTFLVCFICTHLTKNIFVRNRIEIYAKYLNFFKIFYHIVVNCQVYEKNGGNKFWFEISFQICFFPNLSIILNFFVKFYFRILIVQYFWLFMSNHLKKRIIFCKILIIVQSTINLSFLSSNG